MVGGPPLDQEQQRCLVGGFRIAAAAAAGAAFGGDNIGQQRGEFPWDFGRSLKSLVDQQE